MKAIAKITHLNKKGKKTNVYGYIQEDGKIKNVFVDGNYNGLRNEHQCEALRNNFKNKKTERYIYEKINL